MKALEAVPGIEDLTSDLEVSSPQVDVQIDRDKAAALGVTANQIENAFYDAYGPRWVSTIYAPVNEYKVLLELAPQFQADPAALSLLYFKATPNQGTTNPRRVSRCTTNRQRRQSAARHRDADGVRRHRRAARHAGEDDAGDRSADRESQRSAPGGDDFVRPEARRRARYRADRCAKDRRADAARRRQRRVRGRGEGVSELARESRRAAAHRRDGRLHRARHSVRELHPSADDSLGSAVGRVRRARHADRVPDGSEHLRLRRHDHADRHRREERDHADRFRARSGARRHDAPSRRSIKAA